MLLPGGGSGLLSSSKRSTSLPSVPSKAGKNLSLIILLVSNCLIDGIGGLVVKLAVAIRKSSSDNVGQPRVRFPADAFLSCGCRTRCLFCSASLVRDETCRVLIEMFGCAHYELKTPNHQSSARQKQEQEQETLNLGSVLLLSTR